MSSQTVSFSTFANVSISGARNWSNVNNAATSDNSRATVVSDPSVDIVAFSNALRATSPSGLLLPPSVRIDGILIEFERSRSNTLQDYQVYIVKGGSATGTNKAGDVAWSTTEAYNSYGGESDLWGTTWTASDFGSGFGVQIAIEGTSFFSSSTASIDHIRATIYYSDPAAMFNVLPEF